MVVKPAGNLTRGRKGLVQPGLKVRGREYLRIIYGPDYTEPANLDRLRPAESRPQALAGPARVRARASRRSTGSPAASRYGGCTSAFSPYSHSSPNQSTRGCDHLPTRLVSIFLPCPVS